MFHVREFIQPVATPKRSAFWSLAAWPLRVIAARRALSQLGSMDDRELADVGLSRQDLRDATALGLWDDPTKMFAERARERHRRRPYAVASIAAR
jgi:uncharacterized protein YjiS (DUF1127 family)